MKSEKKIFKVAATTALVAMSTMGVWADPDTSSVNVLSRDKLEQKVLEQQPEAYEQYFHVSKVGLQELLAGLHSQEMASTQQYAIDSFDGAEATIVTVKAGEVVYADALGSPVFRAADGLPLRHGNESMWSGASSAGAGGAGAGGAGAAGGGTVLQTGGEHDSGFSALTGLSILAGGYVLYSGLHSDHVPAATPEPTSVLSMGFGLSALVGLGTMRRRRSKR